jgi:acyl-CoA thioesterase FadM
MILAELRITYRAPAIYGETLAIETRVVRIGRSSFTMEHRISAPDSRYGPRRLVAVAESVLVTYDYAAERPVPVPEWLVDGIEAFEGRKLRG